MKETKGECECNGMGLVIREVGVNIMRRIDMNHGKEAVVLGRLYCFAGLCWPYGLFLNWVCLSPKSFRNLEGALSDKINGCILV